MSKTNIARLKVGTLGTLCCVGSYYSFGSPSDDLGIISPVLGALGLIFLWASVVIVDE
jgi:hypothetical protein